MTDIRLQVLTFAKASVGKRIWARVHRYTTKKQNGRQIRTLKSLIQEYKWKNTKYKCSDAVTSWETGANNIIYSDNSRKNDFKGKNKAAKKSCDIAHGECWDLAYAALDKNNGLSTSINYGRTSRKWSKKLVNNLNDIKGGEIIEFKNFYFIEFTMTGESSSWKAGIINYEHTAIIGSKVAKGKVTVYHQNYEGSHSVHTYLFPLKSLIKSESNKKTYLACGGNAVKNLISSAKTASDIKKLNTVLKKIEKYIKKQKNINTPSPVKIYIPQSNP